MQPSYGDSFANYEEELKANVLETISTWSSIDITLKLQKSVSLGNMLDELVNMP